MFINRFHSLKPFFSALILFMGIFCIAVSIKADQWGDWTYTVSGSNVTITGYKGVGGDVTVPSEILSVPVTSIGDVAFYFGTNLNSVVIGSNVVSIGNSAFGNCKKMKSVTIPNTVARIDGSAFGYCSSLTNVIIPSGVPRIEAMTFDSCTNLVAVTIPDSITNIDLYAFYGCESLGVVSLPNSIVFIGFGAFVNSGLTNVIIPASVTSIGYGAFGYCTRLTEISVDASNAVYSSMDGVLFNKNQTTLIQFPGGRAGSYTIPFCVTNIGIYAFESCIDLTSVTISSNITAIPYEAFYECHSLINVSIPSSITSIGDYAFGLCTSLVGIMIPASVNSIGAEAFLYCSNLAGVYFQGDAPNIDSYPVFDGDDILTIYYYPWTSGWTDTFGGRPTQINPDYTQWLLNNNFSTNGTESTTNDFDEDGMLNWQEYLAGTSPTNYSDKLAISSMGSGTNAAILTWVAKSNVSYQVMKSSDLHQPWGNAPSGQGTNQQSLQVAPMDGLLHYADPNNMGASNAFYRVNVVP